MRKKLPKLLVALRVLDILSTLSFLNSLSSLPKYMFIRYHWPGLNRCTGRRAALERPARLAPSALPAAPHTARREPHEIILLHVNAISGLAGASYRGGG